MSKSEAPAGRARRKTKVADADGSAERRQRIAEAAYYKAEQRGFAPGYEEIDWLEAEREIDGESAAR